MASQNDNDRPNRSFCLLHQNMTNETRVSRIDFVLRQIKKKSANKMLPPPTYKENYRPACQTNRMCPCACLDFVFSYLLRYFMIPVLFHVPVFWHRTIQSFKDDDRGSVQDFPCNEYPNPPPFPKRGFVSNNLSPIILV